MFTTDLLSFITVNNRIPISVQFSFKLENGYLICSVNRAYSGNL